MFFQISTAEQLLHYDTDCSMLPPYERNITTYRHEVNIQYPVNLARNTARLAAQTYFVVPSDIELYPSINFIPGMLHNNSQFYNSKLLKYE